MTLLENQRTADIPAGMFQDLEEQLMANIIHHFKDYNEPIASDEWLMRKLAEIGKLNQENIKIIAKSTGVSQTAMEWMLNEMAEKVLAEIEPGMRQLVRRGLVGEAVPAQKSKNVKQVLTTMQGQAKDTLNLCNTTMLYKARDAYKKLVGNIASTADEIADKQQKLHILNKHATSAVIGAESRQQALTKCIKEFNDRGIPAFVDKRGREWTPEAYVNMAMRSTSNTMAAEVQMARADDYGLDLVEVDSHSGARPKCARDQGKIFDRSNKSEKYPHWNTSSYGEPDGLLGINCGHHIYPYMEGVSIRRYFPTEDMDANDKLYKETQVQRALERDIRKQKRECMLYDELGIKEAFEESAVTLKQKEARLKSFVNGNSQLHRRTDREQVLGFDKRISSKAVVANKRVDSAVKSVAKAGTDDIIKIDARPGTAKYRKLKQKAIIERGVSEKRPVFTADTYGKLAGNIPKKEGYYDIVMHGTPKTVEFFGERTDVKTIAEILRKREDYTGTPVRLLSCSTGKGKDCFAQRLANELKVDVEAPDDIIWARSDRKYTIGPTKYRNTGEMITFHPEGE